MLIQNIHRTKNIPKRNLPAGETWGQLLIFKSFRVSLLLATNTLRDGSSTGVSSILSEERDLEFTNTTVRAETKCDCKKGENIEIKTRNLIIPF